MSSSSSSSSSYSSSYYNRSSASSASNSIQIDEFQYDTDQDEVDTLMKLYEVESGDLSFIKYFVDHDYEESKSELILRFTQSIVNYWSLESERENGENNQTKLNKNESVLKLFSVYWTSNSGNFVDRFLEMIKKFLNGKCSLSAPNLTKHVNLCLVISVLSRKYADELCDSSKLIDYLKRIILNGENAQLLMYAMISVDRLALSGRENLKKLITLQVKNILEIFSDRHLVNSVRDAVLDYRTQQVANYSRWCLVNIFQKNLELTEGFKKPQIQTLNPKDKNDNLILSNDCLSFRGSQGPTFPSVRGTIAASSTGIYFYEAHLQTCGKMQIGWATKECFISEDKSHDGQGVGDDRHSIALDAYECAVWHDRRRNCVDQFERWSVGDVIGCLVDMDRKRFRFYINGEEIKTSGVPIYFSRQAYYPAASISNQVAPQAVYFNFGQERFRFPPEFLNYKDFYDNEFNNNRNNNNNNYRNQREDNNHQCLLCKIMPKMLQIASDEEDICSKCSIWINQM